MSTRASAQGLIFHALVSEESGCLGAGALIFVEYLASHAGASPQERKAFATFALQRLRFATVKGTCTVINARLSSGPPSERQSSTRGLSRKRTEGRAPVRGSEFFFKRRCSTRGG